MGSLTRTANKNEYLASNSVDSLERPKKSISTITSFFAVEKIKTLIKTSTLHLTLADVIKTAGACSQLRPASFVYAEGSGF